jgi:mono/diheme cytochrome c family protein
MSRLVDAVLAAYLISVLMPRVAGAQPIPTAATASSARGERLFIGLDHFRNGGPACISCHNIAGLQFPGGGTLGPDLTGAYKKLGPNGTQSALQTLYFRVMTPIYTAHPLMPGEQVDLTAYLEQAGSRPAPHGTTLTILLAAILLGAIFVGFTGLLWRDRVRSVRGAMVARAMRRQGANKT